MQISHHQHPQKIKTTTLRKIYNKSNVWWLLLNSPIASLHTNNGMHFNRYVNSNQLPAR